MFDFLHIVYLHRSTFQFHGILSPSSVEKRILLLLLLLLNHKLDLSLQSKNLPKWLRINIFKHCFCFLYWKLNVWWDKVNTEIKKKMQCNCTVPFLSETSNTWMQPGSDTEQKCKSFGEVNVKILLCIEEVQQKSKNSLCQDVFFSSSFFINIVIKLPSVHTLWSVHIVCA